MATLFLASGLHEGAYFPLGKKSLVVGRGEGLLAQVVDPKISRRHVQIRFDEELLRYWAVDLGSSNGVFVDGRRISNEAPLRDDELIRIGDTLLYFTLSDFRDQNNALAFFKKRGEQVKETLRDKTVQKAPAGETDAKA